MESTCFIGTITRRKKTKSSHPRFYLYDLKEQLIMAAEERGRSKFSISDNANSLKDHDNPSLIGILEYKGSKGHWSASIDDKEKLHFRYLSSIEKGSNSIRKITVVRFDDDGNALPELVQEEFYNSFKEAFPDVKTVQKSRKNFYFSYPDTKSHAFSLAKTAEDEAHFAVSPPLTLFQAFCIACTAFYQQPSER